MMDKQTQFPCVLEVKDTHVSAGTCTLEDPVVVHGLENLTEIHDTVLQDNRSSSTVMPSFNSLNVLLNEHIRKNIPFTTKLPDLKRSKINYSGKTCVREFITQIEEYFLFKNF